MMNYTNGIGLRWYQRAIITALVAGFEGLYHVRRLLGIAAILALLAPTFVTAAGTNIADRQAGLCARLGRPEGCQVQYTPAGSVWLTVMVSDFVVEPGGSPVPGYSSAIQIDAGRRGIFSRMHQVGEQVYGQCAAIPACVTVECVELRPQIEGYTGPTEADLLTTQDIINKVIYQTADLAMATQIQAAYGRAGLPTVTSVSRVTIIDGSNDPHQPTIAKMRARFAFAE